jgi:hypothetical protein
MYAYIGLKQEEQRSGHASKQQPGSQGPFCACYIARGLSLSLSLTRARSPSLCISSLPPPCLACPQPHVVQVVCLVLNPMMHGPCLTGYASLSFSLCVCVCVCVCVSLLPHLGLACPALTATTHGRAPTPATFDHARTAILITQI